jgi:hypothetical protein
MTTGTLEERLNTLETRLDTLQRLFEERLLPLPKKEKRGWQAIVGTFANDSLYEEAMRLGREWRESQFDETDEETPWVHILDTNPISILERRGSEAERLMVYLSTLSSEDIYVTVISYEEQIRGWTAAIALVNNANACNSERTRLS